jgi:DNA-binding winged helix-turn-helix (wHTH) protein
MSLKKLRQVVKEADALIVLLPGNENETLLESLVRRGRSSSACQKTALAMVKQLASCAQFMCVKVKTGSLLSEARRVGLLDYIAAERGDILSDNQLVSAVSRKSSEADDMVRRCLALVRRLLQFLRDNDVVDADLSKLHFDAKISDQESSSSSSSSSSTPRGTFSAMSLLDADFSSELSCLAAVGEKRLSPAEFDATNRLGRNVVHASAERGWSQLLSYLLGQGGARQLIDSPTSDVDARAPLHLAVLARSEACVRVLVDAGADVARADAGGYVARQLTNDASLLRLLELSPPSSSASSSKPIAAAASMSDDSLSTTSSALSHSPPTSISLLSSVSLRTRKAESKKLRRARKRRSSSASGGGGGGVDSESLAHLISQLKDSLFAETVTSTRLHSELASCNEEHEQTRVRRDEIIFERVKTESALHAIFERKSLLCDIQRQIEEQEEVRQVKEKAKEKEEEEKEEKIWNDARSSSSCDDDDWRNDVTEELLSVTDISLMIDDVDDDDDGDGDVDYVGDSDNAIALEATTRTRALKKEIDRLAKGIAVVRRQEAKLAACLERVLMPARTDSTHRLAGATMSPRSANGGGETTASAAMAQTVDGGASSNSDSSSPEESMRQAAMDARQVLRGVYTMECLLDKSRAIYAGGDIAKMAIHADLPRLARNFEICDASGKLALLFSADDSIEKCMREALRGLAATFDGDALGERIDAQWQLDGGEPSDRANYLLRFFVDTLGVESGTMRVLRACNQAIIAPYVTLCKKMLDDVLPFNSVRNSWKILVQMVPSRAVIVTHKKRERAAPAAIDTFGHYFEFEWQVEFTLDAQLSTVLDATFSLTDHIILRATEAGGDDQDVADDSILFEFQQLLLALTTGSLDPHSPAVEKSIRQLRRNVRKADQHHRHHHHHMGRMQRHEQRLHRRPRPSSSIGHVSPLSFIN